MKKQKQSMEERLEKVIRKHSTTGFFDLVDGYIALVDFITSEINLAQEEITISLQKDYKKDLDEILKKKKRELLKTAEVNYQRGKEIVKKLTS